MPIHAPKGIVALLLTLMLWGAAGAAPAWAWGEVFQVKAGNDAFEEGDYEDSVEKYTEALKKDAESDIINFNLGAAYYKQQQYDRALEHLRKAILTEDDTLRQKTYYNLGNASYQAGRLFLEERDINTAVEYYEEAVAEYEKALELVPDDADARHNYEFVKKELEKLKQQQQQQSRNQDQQDKQNPDQQQDQQQQQNQDQQQDQQQQQNQDQQQDQQQQQNQDQQQNQPQNQPPDQQQQQNQNQNQQQQDQQQDQSQDQQQQDQPQDPPPGGGEQDEPQQDPEKQERDNQQPSPQPNRAGADFDDLTEREAQMLLEDYQQNEEPKGLLLIRPRVIPEPVTKDW